jgi:hypothetical protein
MNRTFTVKKRKIIRVYISLLSISLARPNMTNIASIISEDMGEHSGNAHRKSLIDLKI